MSSSALQAAGKGGGKGKQRPLLAAMIQEGGFYTEAGRGLLTSEINYVTASELY